MLFFDTLLVVNKIIFKNSAWLLGAQVFIKVISFFYTIFLARSLGVSEFGLYVTALAYFSIFSSMVDFGFNKFLIREVAKDKMIASKLLWNILILRLTLTAVLFAVFSIILYFLDQDKLRVTLILLATIAILPQSVAFTFDAIFIAAQKLHFSALALFFTSALTSILGVIFISLGFGPIGAINALIFGQITYFLALAVLLKKYNLLSFASINLYTIKKVVSGSLPYGLLGIIGLISFRIDTVLLSYFRGNSEVGIYGAAYKFLEAVVFIPSVLAIASFPVFSKFIHINLAYVKKIYFKSIKIMLIVGLGIVLLYLIFLPEIMKFILPNYIQSIGILQILSLSIPFIFMHVLSNQLLLSTDRHLKQLIVLYLVLFLINLILYIIFIPLYGSIGAAWITVLSEISTSVAFFLYLNLRVFKKV